MGLAAMQQIAEWLEKLGLSEYSQLFAENHIDFTLLRDLTDVDLKELGVASFGHRRKILRAIAELGRAPTATVATAPVIQAAAVRPSPTSAPAAQVNLAGERRFLTVLFCDLVGSTGISARLDAEE